MFVVAIGLHQCESSSVARGYTDAENAEIADIIRDLRTQRGLTQHELCIQAGLSPYTVNKLETSTSHVRPATMKSILEALGRFDRVPRGTVERVCSIYRFNPSVIDSSAISEGDGFDAIGAATTKDLHMLLDRAINAAGELPGVAQAALLHTIHAMLSSIAGESRPTTRLAKHYPPQRVGDLEVTVVEPVDPPPPPPATGTTAHRKNHG